MRYYAVSFVAAFLLAQLTASCASQSDDGVPSTPASSGLSSGTPAPEGTSASSSSGGTSSSGTLPPPVVSGNWQLSALTDMPASWASRDGASIVQLGSGRLLMIGGWNAYCPWGPNAMPDELTGDRLTNEVWKSDDLGKSWQLLLPHDPNAPETGPNARFPPQHAVGVVTHAGHAVVMGSDGSVEHDYLGDVWHSNADGTVWTKVATTAPTLNRILFMTANFKGDIYVMGGQESPEVASTAHNDVYRSTDGGLTWTRLADAPWSPRGMIFRPVESNGKLFVVGGGNYADTEIPGEMPQQYNGVYAFDGQTWQTVLPEGHKQFGAAFYQPLAAAQNRLWLLNGYDFVADTDLSRAFYSDDDGKTWLAFQPGSGGVASHADAVIGLGDRLIRLSGDLGSRTVWELRSLTP